MSAEPRIAFLGGGAMGGAIIRGLLANGVATAAAIRVCDPIAETRAALTQREGVQTTADFSAALKEATVVVLAVKPQEFSKAAAAWRPALPAGALVISIMAGVRLASIMEALGATRAVRVMPNLAAAVGESFSTWTATPAVDESDRAFVRRFLGAIGVEREVGADAYVDMATAVAGSGPGYLALVLESLIDGAVQIGLPRALATEMVMQTALGTARWALADGRHPAELRANVTSPGGATAAGLLALERGGVRAALIEAVIAAHERSQALGG